MKEGWEIAVWDDRSRPLLILITPTIFEWLPNGTILHSISGQRKVKGKDDFDMDTRAGFLAFGFKLEHARDPIGRGYEHDDRPEELQMPGGPH